MHLPVHNSTNSTVGAVRNEARAADQVRRHEGLGCGAACAGVARGGGGVDALGVGPGRAAWVGERAVAWVLKYVSDARPLLVCELCLAKTLSGCKMDLILKSGTILKRIFD